MRSQTSGPAVSEERRQGDPTALVVKPAGTLQPRVSWSETAKGMSGC